MKISLSTPLSDRSIITIPTVLTLARLIWTFFMMGALVCDYSRYDIYFYGTFIAFLTDHLDGILARKLNQSTLIGEILDQFCDSLLILVVLFFFLYNYQIYLGICLLYLTRELWVYVIRRYAALSNIRISSNRFGKLGSFLFCIGLFIAFLATVSIEPFGPFFKMICNTAIVISNSGITSILLYAGLFLLFLSAYFYTKQCFQSIRIAANVDTI